MKHKYQWLVFPAVLIVVSLCLVALAALAPKKSVRVEQPVAVKAEPSAKPEPTRDAPKLPPMPKHVEPRAADPGPPRPLGQNLMAINQDLQQPQEPEALESDRTWQTVDGKLIQGKLDGVTADLSVAFISGKSDQYRVLIKNLRPLDRKFCELMHERHRSSIEFRDSLDLEQYQGGFVDLNKAIHEFAKSIYIDPDSVTSAQFASISKIATTDFYRTIDGLSLKIPVVTYDAQTTLKKGRKQLVQVSTQSVFKQFPFTYMHSEWMSETEALKQSKGDVWWINAKVGASQRAKGTIVVEVDPVVCVPRMESLNESSGFVLRITMSVTSITKASDSEAVEILNNHNWGK